jgi:flagellar motor switch/type III secretory pathway protein FliN
MNDMSKVATGWRPWLPESALARGGVDQALAEVARHWSAKWLARKSVRPLGALVAPHKVRTHGPLRWTTLDDCVAIAASSTSTERLAALLLGEAVPTALGDADRNIVDKLVHGALQDLQRRLAELFGLPPEAHWRQLSDGEAPSIAHARACQLGDEDADPFLHLYVATEAIVALAKARATRPAARDAVKPIAAGLATQQVDVSAAMGRCSLTLADFAGLGVGDVLLLDRKTDAPLALSIDGLPARRGTCSVQRDGDLLELKLLEPLAS